MTQAILAGFLIGVGDIALMSSQNRTVGAFLFAVALMCIIYFELPLFTGKVGFVIKDHNVSGVLLALIFNVIGATLAVWLYTFMIPESKFVIRTVVATKFSKTFLALFIAGVFCNVLIHLAVSTKHTIIVVLCVMAFIICGFEHSIADVPYVLLDFSWHNLAAWAFVLLGNTVGGIATEAMLKFMKEDKASDITSDSDSVNEVLDEGSSSPMSGVFPGLTMPSFEDNQPVVDDVVEEGETT